MAIRLEANMEELMGGGEAVAPDCLCHGRLVGLVGHGWMGIQKGPLFMLAARHTGLTLTHTFPGP